MLDVSGINVWSIVAVWVLYMVVGAWWYSPAGFAKRWSKHTGIDIMKIPTGQANKIIFFVALSALVQAFTLAVLLNSLRVSSVGESLSAGLFIWFGLTAATTVGVTLYSKRKWGFFWLNASYFFVVMAIGSVIYAVWK